MGLFDPPVANLNVEVCSHEIRITLTLGGRVLELEVPLERVRISWKEGTADQEKPQQETSR